MTLKTLIVCRDSCVLLILLIMFVLDHSVCARDCGGKAYGRDCRVSCDSCTGNCDDITGYCKSGKCLDNWAGVNCQKRNIAFGKPTKQSTTYVDETNTGFTYTSDLVVDGNNGQGFNKSRSCSSTMAERQSYPSLSIDLQQQHYISEITLFPRLYDETTLNGMVVYVSNNSEFSPEFSSGLTSCYRNVVVTTTPIRVQCGTPILARYVMLQQPNVNHNNGRLLALCEVQIWECSAGTYGEMCENVCGDCIGGHATCNAVSGHCHAGCLPGWFPPLCHQPCPPGSYGHNCTKRCQSCAGNTQCDPVSGVCTHGCASGWKGIYCDTAEPNCKGYPDVYSCKVVFAVCTAITCSGMCVLKCGHCLSGSCDTKFNTGECISGCHSGYQLPYCNTSCSPGTYGINCSMSCGYCDLNAQCDVITGHCPGKCRDSWQGPRCQQAVRQVGDKQIVIGEEANIGAIVGGILATICLLAVALVIYLLITKKWYKKKTAVSEVAENQVCEPPVTVPSIYSTHSPPPDSNHNNTQQSSATDIKGGNATQQFTSPSPTLVHVDALQTQIESMKADPVLYDTEFKLLPFEPTSPCITGGFPFNKMKNRFPFIIPYDYNRVVLKTVDKDPLFNYINASYITGYKRRKAYIVTQAPLDTSIFDFWRMVWQEACTKIIMLTNLAELGRVKCAQYWSEFESRQFGHLIIQLDSALELTDYTLRTFTVSNALTGESRSIRQFHFTSWPDHSAPHYTESLLAFRHLCRDEEDKQSVVVHCSAGIGRSGTYIAIDLLIQHADHDQVVDVCATVKTLRQQRVQMIPSVEQYKFVYDVILDYVNFGMTVIKYSDFSQQYTKLKQSGAVEIHKQYEHIQLRCKVSLDDIKTALSLANIDKNRNHHILAGDSHRLFLSTHIPGSTDYINAVRIPGYKQKTVMFANELPMPHTVVDLWRLVYDHSCVTIVLMGDVDPIQQETVGVYWMEEAGFNIVEPFQIEMVSSRHLNDTTVERTFRIKFNQGKSKERIVKQFHFASLSHDQTTLPDKAEFLTLLQNVARWQHENGSPPLIVQCLDGATYTGLYCTLLSLLEQLDLLKLVDVSRTVRMLRVARPQFIPTVEQYEYLYEIINFYITRLDSYT